MKLYIVETVLGLTIHSTRAKAERAFELAKNLGELPYIDGKPQQALTSVSGGVEKGSINELNIKEGSRVKGKFESFNNSVVIPLKPNRDRRYVANADDSFGNTVYVYENQQSPKMPDEWVA